jgi:antitoxin PrlF
METQEHLRTVTKKGQVTIPLAVRQLLGVNPYDRVTFRVTDGRVELLPSRITLEAAYGAVRPRSRPENWGAVRRQAHEERAQRQASKLRARRRGAR